MASIASSSPARVALSGGGGAPASPRPYWLGTQATPALTNAVGWGTDFWDTTIGTATFESGSGWHGSLLSGTGTVGLGASSSGRGTLALTTQASTVGSCTGVDLLARATSGPTYQPSTSVLWGGTAKTYAQVIFSSASNTSHNYGFGWAASVPAVGTIYMADTVNDPDTICTGQSNLLFTRHAAAYSGDSAGDLICRVYGSGTEYSAIVVPSATMTAGATAFHKLEVLYDGAGTLYVWFDGALGTGFPLSIASVGWASGAGALRPTFQHYVTASTTARGFNIDLYYHECQLSAAR